MQVAPLPTPRLSDDEHVAWLDAVTSVDEVANTTDSASPSKRALTALQLLVRAHPVVVVRELLA